MAKLERDQATAVERDRILRDMHDGLGLQLISSLRLVEKHELSREQTAALLVEAMDEMRIAIDSVKPTGQDLLVMLGNLRSGSSLGSPARASSCTGISRKRR